jgi:hypothetical protein
MRRALALIVTLGLAACVTPGGDGPVPADAITGGAVATTALPPPAAVAVPEEVAAGVVAEEPVAGVVAEAAAAEAVAEAAAVEEPAAGEPAGEEPAAGEPAAEPVTEAPVAAPPPPPGPAQLACERRGGSWLRVIEGSEARSCVRRTRDSGKRCDDGTDCQGDCLARSGTCAPVMPLFGCQDILDDTGRWMTQCIE